MKISAYIKHIKSCKKEELTQHFAKKSGATRLGKFAKFAKICNISNGSRITKQKRRTQKVKERVKGIPMQI